MKLILVRHGETEENRLRQYIGRTDVPLNERGREQALAVAQRMENMLIHQVVHSPYRRTLETAKLILQSQEAWRSVAWRVDHRLEELHFGEWEGLTYQQVEQLHPERLWAWYDDPWKFPPPQGESLADLEQRVAEWVEELVDDRQEETWLVVSHGGPLRWFLAEHVLRDRSRFHALKWATGQMVVCTYKSGTWSVTEGEVSFA